GLRAVEDVVGRDVDEAPAGVSGGARQGAGSERVHREGALALALGGVDAVVRGRVEDDVGLDARHERPHGPLVGDVERLPAARPGELVAEAPAQLGAELAASARDERPHAPIDSATAKSLAVRPAASWVVSVSVTFA